MSRKYFFLSVIFSCFLPLSFAVPTFAAVTPFAVSSNVTADSSRADIKNLQTLLNTTIAAGLPLTGKFGPQTTKAIEKFQTHFGIVKKGHAGFGEIGPKTRAKMNELIKKRSAKKSSKQPPSAKQSNKKTSIPKSVTINKSAANDDSFLHFFNAQTKKRQDCIRRSFSAAQLKKWFANKNATLSVKEISKVSRCVGHYIEY